MSRLDITVRTPDGDVTCKGLPTPVPGLYVVDDSTSSWGTFSVVHSSGIAAGQDFPEPEAALAFAQAAGRLLDWSQTAAQVQAALDASQDLWDLLNTAVIRHGGSTGRHLVSAEQVAAWSQP